MSDNVVKCKVNERGLYMGGYRGEVPVGEIVELPESDVALAASKVRPLETFQEKGADPVNSVGGPEAATDVAGGDNEKTDTAKKTVTPKKAMTAKKR